MGPCAPNLTALPAGGTQTQSSWFPRLRLLLKRQGRVAVSTVTLGSKRSRKTFQVDGTMCKAGSEEAIGMAGGSDPQGHVLLWKRGEEAGEVARGHL